MKRTESGYRAHAFEHIQAASAEGFSGREIFVIEGMAGFFRRLTQKAASLNPKRIIAFFGESLIDLVPAEAINEEFTEAGYSEHGKVLTMAQAASAAVAEVVIDATGHDDQQNLPLNDGDGATPIEIEAGEVVNEETGEVLPTETATEGTEIVM